MVSRFCQNRRLWSGLAFLVIQTGRNYHLSQTRTCGRKRRSDNGIPGTRHYCCCVALQRYILDYINGTEVVFIPFFAVLVQLSILVDEVAWDQGALWALPEQRLFFYWLGGEVMERLSL